MKLAHPRYPEKEVDKDKVLIVIGPALELSLSAFWQLDAHITVEIWS